MRAHAEQKLSRYRERCVRACASDVFVCASKVCLCASDVCLCARE